MAALDFAPRLEPGRRSLALLCLLVVAALTTSWLAFDQRRHREAMRLSLVDRESTPRAVVAAPPVPPRYAESATALLKERSAIWPRVLASLEAVTLDRVTIQGVDVNAHADSVGLEVAFDDYSRLFDGLTALSAGEADIDWRLMQVQPIAPGKWVAVLSAGDAEGQRLFQP